MASDREFRIKGRAKGIDDVIAARTAISLVDGANGRLVYRGYDIEELAGAATFESNALLLWSGRYPAAAEVQMLDRRMRPSRMLGARAHRVLMQMPDDSDPLAMLRTVISAQGAGPRTIAPTLEAAIATAAAVPTILANQYRRSHGLTPVPARPDLGHAANYLFMLTGEEPDRNRVDALNTYLVLLADHGLNSSTFTARAIASTGSDLASSLVGAIGSLKGPLHGGAPLYVMEQLDEVRRRGDVEAWVADVLDRRERIMGFGHVLYRTYDPRARILREMCRSLNPEFFELASKVEEVATRELNERHPERPMATNVEFYSAGVLEYLGLPRELFTPTLAAARTIGWTAHVLEQVEQQRAGTAKIIRPQSEYIGPEHLTLPSNEAVA
jgi:citrate synthase